MQLKITNTDGTTVYSDDVVTVTCAANGKITAVTYGATTVSAIAAWNGTNPRYEIGLVGEFGVINAWFSN
jgi:hypothetical protein